MAKKKKSKAKKKQRKWTPRPGAKKKTAKPAFKILDRIDFRTGKPIPNPEVVPREEPKKTDSPFAGHTFHITKMEVWGQDYVNAEGQAHIKFDGRGTLGSMHFGYIKGWIDYREVVRDGRPAVEWSWNGHDYGGGDDVGGRGWAVLRDDGGLSGRIFLHQGDDSSFEADLGN